MTGSTARVSTLPTDNLQRVVFLDVLRFFAAATVVLQHSLEERCDLCALGTDIVSPGVFGVVLFFIISGFVIPMTAGKNFSLSAFLIKRIFRIYPLALFSFVLVAVVGTAFDLPAFHEVRTAGVGQWIANLLLVQDYVNVPAINGVTWTLSLEIAWYVIFAACFLLLGKRFDALLAVVAPVGMVLLVLVSLGIDHRLPLGRIGMIYVAILGCRAYRHHMGEIGLSRLLLDLGVYIVVAALSNYVSFGYFTHPTISMTQAMVPWTLAPIIFIGICTIPTMKWSRLLNNPTLAWLGAISYSTYLLHPIAIHLADAVTPPAISFFVGIAGTFVLSVIGYRLIEAPSQVFGKRLAAVIGPRPVERQPSVKVLRQGG